MKGDPVAPRPSPAGRDSRENRAENLRLRGLHIYAILFGLILLSAGLTWVVPAGSYERTALPNGRESVVPGSFETVDPAPVGVMDVVTAIPDGLRDAASVVFLVLLVGGSVGVVARAGILRLGIGRLLALARNRVEVLLPVLMFAFAALAAVVGMQELAIAYLPIVTPLLLRLGCDRMTALAVCLLPTTLGSAFGPAVPATVGIGHQIAGLPMFSGAGYRAAFWLAVQVAAVWFVVRHARRTRRPHQDPATPVIEGGASSRRERIAGTLALILVAGFVGAVLRFGLDFEQISGLFVGMAVIISLAAGRRVNRICSDFDAAFREILPGALICGVARGVPIVLEQGGILDTLVFGLETLVGNLPAGLTAVGVLLSQTLFNFVVPSGSGQALVTLPVLVPLADLVGLTRQVVVLATQWGDGITNIVFPTSGYFMAALVVAGIRLPAWLRFYAPLFVIVLAIAIGGLILAQAIRLGPF